MHRYTPSRTILKFRGGIYLAIFNKRTIGKTRKSSFISDRGEKRNASFPTYFQQSNSCEFGIEYGQLVINCDVHIEYKWKLI